MFRLMYTLLISCFLSLSALAGVDVNSAASGELESLPGIGPAKASAIIAYRSEHGAFKSLADLDQVPGIGPATLANIGPLVSFAASKDGQAAATPPAAEPAAPKSAPAGSGINVNTASAAELEALPGIGPSKASAIIADREANGPYPDCAQLQRVRGIGPATVANIAGNCRVK